ncbi:MAG TPA: RNA-binding S4 domain-containing protein [Mesorhizobium sp.]|jgi:ribosome-associated heat shock protein Hsp15|nr:RNA-binding S4 domain-containing protein [Mesorhizobium sp.]
MAEGERQRIDKWLFFARIVKSRSLGSKLVELGRVRINREKAAQPADPVRVGDVLTVNLDRRIAVLRVLDLGERRGPAPEAQALYEDLSTQAKPSGPVSPLDGAEPLRQAKVRAGFAEE